MKKEDFLVEMDDTLKNGVHTPGNLFCQIIALVKFLNKNMEKVEAMI